VRSDGPHRPSERQQQSFTNRKEGEMHKDAGDWKRSAGFLVATITGITILTAACTNSSSNTTSPIAGQRTTYQKALAFARCMHAHGELNWPNPTSQGNFNESRIDINSPQHQRSLIACINLRTADIQFKESTAQRRQSSRSLAVFATCMHSHGYASYPDPRPGSSVSWAGTEVDSSSPTLQSAMKTCGAVPFHNGWWIQAPNPHQN